MNSEACGSPERGSLLPDLLGEESTSCGLGLEGWVQIERLLQTRDTRIQEAEPSRARAWLEQFLEREPEQPQAVLKGGWK